MEKEIWKDIPGYEGLYQVSNLGNVKSLDRIVLGINGAKINKKGCTISIQINKQTKYKTVCLWNKNTKKVVPIHRLIALTFIPNPENKPQVNHINGIKTDNQIENLEWCTQSENTQHAYNTSLIRTIKQGANFRSKLTEKQVLEIRSLYKENNLLNKKEIAKIYNVTYPTINDIVKNKSWTHI